MSNAENDGFPRLSSSSPDQSEETLKPLQGDDANEIYKRFMMLGYAERRLFKAVYRRLYDDLSLRSRSAPLSFYYWAFNRFRVDEGLTATQFSLLSFVWYASNCGRVVVLASAIVRVHFCPDASNMSVNTALSRLCSLGYLVRLSRDPARPHYYVPGRLPIVKMTDKGIELMQRIDKEADRMIYRKTFEQITGIKATKKG